MEAALDRGAEAPLPTRPIVSAGKRIDIRSNIIANCELVKERLGVVDAHDTVLSLACYGPSLEYTAWEMEGDVMSVSGAHDFLLANGYVPKFHADCDPREHKARFVANPDTRIQYLMASQSPQSAVRGIVEAGADIKLWHLDEGAEIRDFLHGLDESGAYVGGGGSIGHRALGVAYCLGYRNFHIFGMDCSFTDKTHAGEHFGRAPSRLNVRCGERTFSTSLVLVEYARQFIQCVNAWGDCTFHIHGDGLLQAMITEGNRYAN